MTEVIKKNQSYNGSKILIVAQKNTILVTLSNGELGSRKS